MISPVRRPYAGDTVVHCLTSRRRQWILRAMYPISGGRPLQSACISRSIHRLPATIGKIANGFGRVVYNKWPNRSDRGKSWQSKVPLSHFVTAIMTPVAAEFKIEKPSRRRCGFGRPKRTCCSRFAISRRSRILVRRRTSQRGLLQPSSSTSRSEFRSRRPSLHVHTVAQRTRVCCKNLQ